MQAILYWVSMEPSCSTLAEFEQLHMTQQHGLLISDSSQAIQVALNAPSSGWHPPTAHHAFRIRHMASNFNTRFKSVEGKRYLISRHSGHNMCANQEGKLHLGE
ncbi:uncharacterized protein DS421_6g191770 [Arachis hypogaea]|nr:uncharacterized protein DS421_6g191770 [Arachis hypogaea]